MNNPILVRLTYLFSRTVGRPERAFSTVESNVPALDILLLAAVSVLWIAGLSAVSFGNAPADLAYSVAGYLIALGLSVVYGGATAITAGIFTGRAKALAATLSFLLAGVVAFSISALPVMIIRLVDSGAALSGTSETIISIGPWLYALALFYSATIKVYRTIPPRAIAYIGLGGLPVVFLGVLLRSLDLPLAFIR